MKVIITGHTDGIGKCLCDIFTRNNWIVQGYSRTTGFDIEDCNARKAILDQSIDADIFINNAYSSTGQTELLKEIIDKWDGLDKKIINLSSKLSYFKLGYSAFLDDYILQKRKQNEIIEARQFLSQPQILNVLPGLVETKMSSDFIAAKLNPKDVANLIYNSSTQDEIYIQNLVIDVPKLAWKNIQAVNSV
jgi:short-subunit dehydrogenase